MQIKENEREKIIQKKVCEGGLNNLSGPFSVAFTVTNKCNYRCRHCYNNSGENRYEEMRDDELLDVARQICELQPVSVCLCGGEPLIRGDIIYDIVEMLSAKCGIVNIVSNGYLISEEVLYKLRKSGINTIQISLDGNTPFLHDNMRCISGAFEKAINAIQLSAKNGFKVAVSFCPHKMNFKNIEETCKLVKSIGGNDFRVMPLILMGRGKYMKNLQLSADEYLWLQQTICNMQKKYQEDDFQISWGDPLDHIYRMPENSKNKMNTYSMEIRSDGMLALTSYLPITFGNLRKHTLKEYWEAGYKDIWGNEKVTPYIQGLYSTNQFGNYTPEPYTGTDIEINIIEK